MVRAIDINNDWTFGKGKNDYLLNNLAVAQLVKTNLQSFVGDCFFSLGDGVDWWSLLGAKNQITLQIAITAVIMNTEGVLSLASPVQVSLNHSTRIFSVTYSVNTAYTNTAGTVQGTATLSLS